MAEVRSSFVTDCWNIGHCRLLRSRRLGQQSILISHRRIAQTTLDPVTGRITQTTTKAVQQFDYQYDAVGRFTNAITPIGEFSYQYDTNGNRLSESTASQDTQKTKSVRLCVVRTVVKNSIRSAAKSRVRRSARVRTCTPRYHRQLTRPRSVGTHGRLSSCSAIQFICPMKKEAMTMRQVGRHKGLWVMASMLVLAGCAHTIWTAAEKEYVPPGGTTAWKFSGAYDVNDRLLTIAVNGDNVIHNTFAPFTPRMTAQGKYAGKTVDAHCAFASGTMGGSFRGKIASSIVSKSTKTGGNTCDVKVDGQEATILYF